MRGRTRRPGSSAVKKLLRIVLASISIACSLASFPRRSKTSLASAVNPPPVSRRISSALATNTFRKKGGAFPECHLRLDGLGVKAFLEHANAEVDTIKRPLELSDFGLLRAHSPARRARFSIRAATTCFSRGIRQRSAASSHARPQISGGAEPRRLPDSDLRRKGPVVVHPSPALITLDAFCSACPWSRLPFAGSDGFCPGV
jgi:hypothetical protein